MVWLTWSLRYPIGKGVAIYPFLSEPWAHQMFWHSRAPKTITAVLFLAVSPIRGKTAAYNSLEVASYWPLGVFTLPRVKCLQEFLQRVDESFGLRIFPFGRRLFRLLFLGMISSCC
jgi:hypothetical protein